MTTRPTTATRLTEHKAAARRGVQTLFYDWMRYVGIENVGSVTLETCPYAVEKAWEQDWYRRTPGALNLDAPSEWRVRAGRNARMPL
jgi:hypothetical protein